MHVAALVKGIAVAHEADSVASEPDGRAMDHLARRAVAQGVELAAAVGDGVCTTFTLGPPPAETVLREAVAWGRSCNVATFGVRLHAEDVEHVDSLATAGALAAAISREGPFDLVLLGDDSGDAGTGQLGAQVAELLDQPFVAGARFVSMQGTWLHVRAEREDGWLQATVPLPAVVSCAAGLIEPCDVPVEGRAAVPPNRIRTIDVAELGAHPGPSGPARLAIEPVPAPGEHELPRAAAAVPPARGVPGRAVAAVLEPDRPELARALLGEAARLADDLDGHVVAFDATASDHRDLGAWGADAVCALVGAATPEDVAWSMTDWALDTEPWALVAPSSAWGREVAARTATRLGAGLAGGVTALDVEGDRLVAWKRVSPEAWVRLASSSRVQLATLHLATDSPPAPRAYAAPQVETITVRARSRVRVASRTHASR